MIDVARVRAALVGSVLDNEHAPGPHGAAVAAVLRDSDRGALVLLIRRAVREGDPWSGHMAFPGGRSAASDADALATALRETREEVGLDLESHAELLGPLPALPAMARGKRAGLSVAPFVFALTEMPPLVHNQEVDELVWAPLDGLFRGEGATTMPYDYEGQRLALPAWNVDGHVVWGLTHRMLETLLDALRRGGQG